MYVCTYIDILKINKNTNISKFCGNIFKYISRFRQTQRELQTLKLTHAICMYIRPQVCIFDSLMKTNGPSAS